MNYMVYAKHNQNDKRYSPMNFSEGTHRNKLVYATLVGDKDRAVGYADKLAEMCPDFSFQVRVAGKATVVYNAAQKASGQAKAANQ